MENFVIPNADQIADAARKLVRYEILDSGLILRNRWRVSCKRASVEGIWVKFSLFLSSPTSDTPVPNRKQSVPTTPPSP